MIRTKTVLDDWSSIEITRCIDPVFAKPDVLHAAKCVGSLNTERIRQTGLQRTNNY